MKQKICRIIVLSGFLAACAAPTAWGLPAEEVDEEGLVLAAGDTVEIEIERHPEYSGLFQIQPDGTLELPLLGPVQTQGLTEAGLQEQLAEKYSRYIRRPVVVVSLTTPQSLSASPGGTNSVYLMGEVKKAGSYPLGSGMTLLQLMAVSGGPILHAVQDHLGNIRATGANIRNISVFRATGETIKVNLEHIQQTGDQSENVILEPGDTVFVPAVSPGEFSILGQVMQPGSYPVTEGMNLMEALVRAGGFTKNGSLKNIRIVRADSADPQTFRVNLWEIFKGGRLEMIPEIVPGDTIFVELTPFYHWERFVSMLRGAAISSESIRIIRDFDERTGGRVYYR